MVSLLLSLSKLALVQRSAGVVFETLSPPLHLVLQREVTLGTTHPSTGTVLHDGPRLRLHLHEAVGVGWASYSMQECHPEGGFEGHALQVAVEAEFGVDLYPQDGYLNPGWQGCLI